MDYVKSDIILSEIEKIKLKSSADKLLKLIDTPEWEDVSAIVQVFLGWEMGQLMEDAIHEVPKTQGRCLILREVIAQIEDKVKELAQRNFSVEDVD